jgi:hypothetical protein
MRARDYLLAVIVFGVSLAACATPKPIIRLVPAGGGVTWIAGRAVLSKQQSDVRVAVAFEHQHGDRLAVRVEVANEGDTELEVGPPDVSFVGCKGTTVESCGLAQRVVDPETELTAIDESSRRQVASAANQAALFMPLLILSMVGDVASLATGAASSTAGLQTAALANRMEHKAARHDMAMRMYESRREMWSNAALRRNTVQPGRAHGGLVFMPIDIDARWVWIHLRVGSLVFPFRFEQTITPVSFPEVTSQGRTSHNR